MLKTILTSLRSADLRKKLAFTAFILLVYRFGSYVPVPGVDLDALQIAVDPDRPVGIHDRRGRELGHQVRA